MLGEALLSLALLELPAGLDASVPNVTTSLLEESLERRTYLLVAEPWSVADSERVTIRLSTDGFASKPDDTMPEGDSLPNELFRARLAEGGVFNVQTQVMSGFDISGGLPGYGQIKVIRADDDPEILAHLDYLWPEAPLRTYLGRPDWSLSQFALIGKGAASGIEADPMVYSIAWKTLQQRLDRDIQPLTYRGMGAALYFDGTNDFVDCGSSSVYNFTTQDFTVECWVYAIGTVTMNLVSRGLGNTDGWSCRINTSRQVEFRTSQSGVTQMTVSTALTLKRWTHVSMVRTGASVAIYLDGVLSVSSSATHINPTTASRNLTFGVSSGATAFLSGVMDEVRIHGVPRSGDWVKAHKDRELTDLTNVLGYWKFNEGTGTTTADSSPTGANGTLTSGPLWVGSLSGGAGIVGRCIPTVFGRFQEREAICVDEKFGVYQVHDTAMEELTTVLHKGAAGYTIEASSGDVADPYDLYTNAPGSGKYRTCKAAGLVRFGGTAPDGRVTITGKGDNVGGYTEDAASVARRVAKRMGTVDPDEFDATAFSLVTAAYPQPVGVASGLDKVSGDSLIVEAMGSIMGWRTVTREGKLSVGVLRKPVTAKFFLTEDDVVLEGIRLMAESVPVQKTRLGYAPYGVTQGPNELATSITGDARIQFGEAFRYTETTTDAAVVAGNASAPVRERTTSLALLADAVTQAAVEQDYWNAKRRMISLPLVQGLHQYSIGDDVELDFSVDTPLLKLDAGWKGRIVGYVENVPDDISLQVIG